MARTPGNWFWFRKGNEHYEKIVAAAAEAYSKGYSVLEISRYLKMRGCRHLYAALRARGIIPLLPRKRGKSFGIPLQFSQALERCGIGYLQWCQSHRFDPDEASLVLTRPLDQFDPIAFDVHLAFYRDFCGVYQRVFPDTGILENANLSPVEPKSKPTFILAPEGIKYCAYIKEHAQTVCFGETPERALSNLRLALAVQRAVVRLKNLSRR